MATTITIPIPYNSRREVAAYCSHAISPQQYYLHNRIGGVGWCVKHEPPHTNNNATGNWAVEASEADLIVLRLRLGV